MCPVFFPLLPIPPPTPYSCSISLLHISVTGKSCLTSSVILSITRMGSEPKTHGMMKTHLHLELTSPLSYCSHMPCTTQHTFLATPDFLMPPISYLNSDSLNLQRHNSALCAFFYLFSRPPFSCLFFLTGRCGVKIFLNWYNYTHRPPGRLTLLADGCVWMGEGEAALVLYKWTIKNNWKYLSILSSWVENIWFSSEREWEQTGITGRLCKTPGTYRMLGFGAKSVT